MKRVYKNWLVRITIGFAALTSLRLVSTLLHMTTLEKLYKPRDFRKTSHLEISQDIIDQLPKYCQNVLGQQMDPINLLFVGTEAGLSRAFEKAGWNVAYPWTPIHLTLGFIQGLFRRAQPHGTFMPLFISVGLQDMGFQKSSPGSSFARHHIRIWRTKHNLPDGNRLWVAAATHETGIRVTLAPPFFPHKMNPDLDYERDFIATELLEQGNLMAGDHKLNDSNSPLKPLHNPHGDPYYTDGHAKVIEIV